MVPLLDREPKIVDTEARSRLVVERRARRMDTGRFMVGVHRLVRSVPAGRVVTYGQVAALLGWPRAARAVGRAMKGCPDGVPWYRVVNASGGISRRANVGSMLTQRMLLEREGVQLRRGRVSLREYRWTSRPAVARDRTPHESRTDRSPSARARRTPCAGLGESWVGASPGARAGTSAEGTRRVSRRWSGQARASVSPGARAR